METECLAPETIQSNTEPGSDENQETQTSKDLLLWCSALKITPEEYRKMSEKELKLRINNLKDKIELKVAKTLIARQKEKLDRIRSRASEKDEEDRNTNKYQRLFNNEKLRSLGGEEVLSEPKINSKESYNYDLKYREPVHSTLPKILKGYRKNNNTDYWKIISKAAANVERIYGGETSQRSNSFSDEDAEYETTNDEKNYDNDRSKNTEPPRFVDHASYAPKKSLNNPGTSEPTFLQIRKVPRTELSNTSNETSPKILDLYIKRSPERSQFSSRRHPSSAQRRPHIEAAIIIQPEIIDENSKPNYQKKENMIEVQSIQSYDINGNSNLVSRRAKPVSHNNQMPNKERPARPPNVFKYKQWDYPYDVNFSQSDSDTSNQNKGYNSYRAKSSSKQRYARQNNNGVKNKVKKRHDRINDNSDEVDENFKNSYQTKKILNSRTRENSAAWHKPGRRIQLIQGNDVDGKIVGIRTVEDYRINGDVIEFEASEGNQIDGTSTSSCARRPIRVIQENGNILGIEGSKEDLVDGNAVEFEAIDDNRNSRSRRRRA